MKFLLKTSVVLIAAFSLSSCNAPLVKKTLALPATVISSVTGPLIQ